MKSDDEFLILGSFAKAPRRVAAGRLRPACPASPRQLRRPLKRP
jgi:hypothetical protein